MNASVSAQSVRILIAADAHRVIDRVSVALKYQGFESFAACTAKEVLSCVAALPPDVVVLDEAMAGGNGLEVLKLLRKQGCMAPVLLLMPRTPFTARVTGLTFGEDDYITKPFSVEEIAARVRAILRRSKRLAPECPSSRISLADIELDDDSREVLKAGRHVDLSATEFRLLRYFMANAGTILPKMRIVDHVWSYDFVGRPDVVESYVSYLRRKIDDGRQLIRTIRGVGYVMREPWT